MAFPLFTFANFIIRYQNKGAQVGITGYLFTLGTKVCYRCYCCHIIYGIGRYDIFVVYCSKVQSRDNIDRQ